jgi:S-(hydroxymethyl)glutathione dehydrogenase / alcohol dehydrogenase
MRVRAAVLAGPRRPFEVRQVELDSPRPHEVLVRIAASGLCGSDLNAIDGKRTLVPFPAVLGHEAAGVVQELGDEVERVRVGDHVVLSILPYCDDCPACLAGRRNHCHTTAAAMRDGALLDGSSRISAGGERLHHFLAVSSFAEYAVVPESAVTVIDAAMPLDRAALLGCGVLTGFGAVTNTAGVEPGARVAVFGCGGVGLSAIQAARIAGAATIVAVDVQAEKLELARTLGATATVDASAGDPVTRVREAADGGVDYAFEAIGRERTIAQAWASLATGGQLVIIGVLRSGAQLTLDADPLIEEKRLAGCYLGSATPASDVPALVGLYLDGRLLLDEVITRRLELGELNEAFERMRAGAEARQVLVFDGAGEGARLQH